jgi:DNA transposition AAA+ family ATPase
MAKKTNEELRLFVKNLIDNGAKQTEVGKELGVSRSQIHKFINGGNVSEEFLEQVELMYQKHDNYVSPLQMKVEDLEFIKTEDATSILGMLAFTEEMNGFGTVLGNAGTGKTETVQHYVNELSTNAVYIRCNCLMATRDIMKAIGKACGIMLHLSSKAEMFNDLVEHLIAHPKMLIFDEIDQIMPNRNINKIETIRNLHDIIKDYGNSIVLVGSLAVEHQLKKRGVSENYGQIDSRIDYMYKTQGLQESELIGIISRFNISEQAQMEVVNIIHKTTKGGIRRLTKILKKCVDLASLKDGHITKDIVREATQIMMI